MTRAWELNNAWRESAGGTVTITFPQPADRLSLNDRHHWAVKARITRAWRHAAALTARNQLGYPRAERSLPPCSVRVTFPVKTNRGRDPHNAIASVKPIIDGLVDVGVWPTDTDEFVTVLDPRFAKGADVVTVELIPREGL